ncbi:MAG: HEPN domain-containing protein [Bacteroidales bacterium]|nr:HEPN domain-containing protein [Bacteroidales bacterium]
MLKSRRFLYVGFMCHQTIEKIFKAFYTSNLSEVAPYSHSLSYLAKKGRLLQPVLRRSKRFY